ncbi:signal transduction protein [Venturia nashicola]|uniref:Signal transduction protein n=1 Tax=Venturia nashicola TaxID=86259 RepID=A0A4Z1P7U8_9PEZI|nr:signal transduction protein [Venturia nashicola]
MPFGWGESHDAYNEVQNSDNKAELSHEVLAGGASFAAFKMFEDNQRKEGKPVSHQFAKELLVGLAGAEVDRLAETKGADYIDRERAKHEAKKNAEHMYDQHYGNEDNYDPNRQRPNERLQREYGKKKVSAVSRALKNVNNTSTGPRPKRSTPKHVPPTPNNSSIIEPTVSGDLIRSASRTPRNNASARPLSIPRTRSKDPERQPLNDDYDNKSQATPGLTRYGSIIGSPVNGSDWGPNRGDENGQSSFALPDPAIAPKDPTPSLRRGAKGFARQPSPLVGGNKQSAYEAGETRHSGGNPLQRGRGRHQPQRVNSMPGNTGSQQHGARPLMRRLMSLGGGRHNSSPSADVPLESYKAFQQLDQRQDDFFHFLDNELEKIESFYKEKEDEATGRLQTMREQLHFMRDSRVEELVYARRDKHTSTRGESVPGGTFIEETLQSSKTRGEQWLHALDGALGAVRNGRFGKNTKRMQTMASPHLPTVKGKSDEDRDYVRRPAKHEIPYRTAKRKLKTAMQEYYRALELLKSYSLLNRKAFRKINKKYDKAVHARPPLRFMNDKVNEAYFVKSDVLEGHIRAVEDLYARYFEGGNYKVAASKLRIKADRPNDLNSTVFRNGIMAAAGACFGLEGLVYGSELLFHSDPATALSTSYLLQIYGGYFLMLILMMFFVIDCRIWTKAKVNYVFVFEFDTRHHLDWRQLAELPCFFALLLGLFMWLNFTRYGAEEMYIYYPIVLISLTAFVLFMPVPILYHRSRTWFLVSMGRLSLSSFFPVEFRDFFLGDMFCSLTYSMGNTALFFCLYLRGWVDPPMCNSSHLRTIGFFSALPGTWRALQCLRRYRDTRNAFPHLANFGKYICTILFYMSLSLYRVEKTSQLRAFFIFCGTINSVYCSLWDLVMDWSLMDFYAHKKLLRENMAFKTAGWYYTAMMIDPILRFNWILYIIVPYQLQHSAVLSFCVAFSEVCRRGIWTIFRVENEHCTNVERFRASRDVPLPYKFRQAEDIAEEGGLLASVGEEQEMDEAQLEEQRQQGIRPPFGLSQIPSRTSGIDMHSTRTEQSANSSTVRRRRKSEQSPLIRRMGSILHMAHAQDFERKKRPEVGEAADKSSDSEEEEEEDDEGSDDIDREVEEAERIVDEEMARVDGADEGGRDGKEGLGEETRRESRADERHGASRKGNGDGDRGEMSSGHA